MGLVLENGVWQLQADTARSLLLADLNFAALASASWSDGKQTVDGIDVAVINTARMDTIGPNGTTGVVMDSKTGTTHEADNRDTGRLHVDLAEVFSAGAWYLTRPMWVTLEFAAALDPGTTTTRQLDLAADTGTGSGGSGSSATRFCSAQLVGTASGAAVRGFRSQASAGDFGSAAELMQPSWIGMLIEPVAVQAFGGTGTPPSAPSLATHASPSPSLNATGAQDPDWFTPEAFAASSRTLCIAVAGKWSTAPILKRLRFYTLDPS